MDLANSILAGRGVPILVHFLDLPQKQVNVISINYSHFVRWRFAPSSMQMLSSTFEMKSLTSPERSVWWMRQKWGPMRGQVLGHASTGEKDEVQCLRDLGEIGRSPRMRQKPANLVKIHGKHPLPNHFKHWSGPSLFRKQVERVDGHY